MTRQVSTSDQNSIDRSSRASESQKGREESNQDTAVGFEALQTPSPVADQSHFSFSGIPSIDTIFEDLEVDEHKEEKGHEEKYLSNSGGSGGKATLGMPTVECPIKNVNRPCTLKELIENTRLNETERANFSMVEGEE